MNMIIAVSRIRRVRLLHTIECMLTSMNRPGTSCGSSIPKTLSHTSPGVVVDGCPVVVVVTISPSDVVLVTRGVVDASVVVVGTIK